MPETQSQPKEKNVGETFSSALGWFKNGIIPFSLAYLPASWAISIILSGCLSARGKFKAQFCSSGFVLWSFDWQGAPCGKRGAKNCQLLFFFFDIFLDSSLLLRGGGIFIKFPSESSGHWCFGANSVERICWVWVWQCRECGSSEHSHVLQHSCQAYLYFFF